MTLLMAMALGAAAPTGAAGDGDGGARSDAAGVLPTAPRAEVLPNGLTLVMVPWDSPGIVAYQTTVRVGSRDEVEADHTGFAHLFEHMMFRGTERFPKDVYEREIQLAGADNSAFTWYDLTNYYMLVPRDSLARIVEIEADRFQRLFYSESDYRTETGAVHGEYNKNASRPSQLMEEALLETAFQRHTYAHSTMGYLADIVKMPGYYEYSRQFFRRFYTPDNCWIVAVGDFDQDELLAHVTKHYGEWEGTRDQPTIHEEAPQAEPRMRHVDWPNPTSPRMTFGYKIPAFSVSGDGAAGRDSAALDVVHELLFGQSGPLHRKLVIEEKKALDVSSPPGIWSPFTRDPFLFLVDVVLAEGARFDEVEGAVTEELARLARGELAAERLAAVRSNLRYGFLTGLESPQDVALTFALFLSATGDVGALEAYAQRLSEVTTEDVQRVVQDYLVPERRTIVTLSHGKQGGVE